MSDVPDILERIARSCRRQLAARKAAVSLDELKARAGSRGPLTSLRAVLARPGLGVIAELKKASPSQGLLREDFPVAELAAGLVAGGAVALSVLTEKDHFQGDPAYLAAAGRAVPGVPLLRKDFLVDSWQVWESRALGADAVLLIAALLEQKPLEMMMAAAADAGVDCLVEVHDRNELVRAMDAGADLVGVNARDLHTFRVDLQAVRDLGASLPETVLGVAESGIQGWEDLELLQQSGYQGVLVGTALMRRQNPGETLGRWLRQMPPAPPA
jgi:indole-3-glycerol phosphate synthase